MNMLNKFLTMFRNASLIVCLSVVSAPAFADPVYDLDTNIGRYMFFDDYSLTNGATPTWRHFGPVPVTAKAKGSLGGTNHVHKSTWSFMNCRIGRNEYIATNSVSPVLNGNPYVPNGTNYCVYMQNTTESLIHSPVFTTGIGSLYMDAISLMSGTIDMSIYIATNMVDGLGFLVPIDATANTNRTRIVWEPAPLDTFTLFSGDPKVAYKRELNIRQPICLMIKRTNVSTTTFLDDYYAVIDNIRVSEPPADVVMDKDLTPFNIYPSVNKNMNVQFRIDNVAGPNITAAGGTWQRTNVLLVSRWNYLNQITTPWVTNKMQCVNTGDGAGNGELWQPQTAMRVYPDAGDLEYGFICYFNGTYYQSKDYTVYPAATNLTLFPPENKSPRLYSADGMLPGTGSITNNPFVFPLRLFPSEHGSVTAMLYVNGSTTPVVLPMTLSNTNKWQAKYDVVNHPEATNLLWYFEATGAYTNNFRTTAATTYWQNINRSRIQNGVLPYGDNCGLTDASITNRPEDWFGVTVTPGESSYILLSLDTAKTNYLAGRGEYQNFNAWNTGAAAQNAFTDADDKYPKVSYSQNFTAGWQPNYFAGISNWFGTVTFTAGYTAPLRVGPEQVYGQATYWNAGSFQYVAERTAIDQLVVDAETTGQRRNQGIRLLGGSDGLGLGYYQGSLGQKNAFKGVGTVTYKARLSRPLATDDDYNYNVAYRWTDMMRTNYVLKCLMNANTASPEAPSISIIAYYQSPRKFYEYRITQLPDARDINGTIGVNAGRDGYVVHQIWKWNNSNTPTLLAESKRANTAATAWGGTEAAYDAKITTAQSNPTEFRLYTTLAPTPSVTMRIKFQNTDIPFPAGSTTYEVTDSSSPILFGGYGFHSADCGLLVTQMALNNSGPGAIDGGGVVTAVVGGSSANQINDWYWPTELYTLSGNTFAPATQTTSLKVLTSTSELGPWVPFNTQTVNSYAYQNYSATTNAWENLCARIQANDTLGVVVDGVRVGSWRGETITSYPFSDNWMVTEGWISSNATDKTYVHLDASQADPSLIQGVRSERILGLGSISFDYRVTVAPAQIKVQYTANAYPQDDSEYGWQDVTNLTFGAATGWTSANYFLAIAPATNLYVRIVNVVTNRKATVDLDNITIWNNPTNSPNDWSAYNMKISDNETDKWWLDKKTEATPRSGYLNHNTTANTIAGRPMNIFNPYIMAPRLTRGLGTISFLARAFTSNYTAGDTNTSITVYATTLDWDKNRPDAQWDKLYTFKGITNGYYRPFFYSHPIVPNNYKAVKLVVHGVIPLVATPQRVCVDEIVVTEAIYPRFDITGVKLLLQGSPSPIETKQPLEGEDIGIEAQLTNVLLDPANIQVFVTYVLGTNTWGISSAPVDKQITKPLSLVDAADRIYRTTGDFMTTGIPEQEKYNVVQYMVWASYDGNGVHTNYQSRETAEHFVNPSWYHPVDLNNQDHSVAGLPKATWSPYYIVYDVPPGSVWINELNLNENSTSIGPRVFLNPYIEIAQPAWMDLTGWQLDIMKDDYSIRLSKRIESKGAIQPALGANGYGLFVVGPYDFEATTYPALSTTTTVHQSVQNIKGDPNSGTTLYPGGYRLRRPMGMYEHAIAYDWDRIYAGSGEVFALNEPPPQTPFKYVGREHYNGSLSYTGGINVVAGRYNRADDTNSWQQGYQTFNWTPGRMNVGQTFPAAPAPGGSNVLITSTLLSPDGLTHGWQNNIRQNPLQFKLKKGQGTNFVFVAEPWFRFYGITSNTVEILSPLQQKAITNYAIVLNNIQTNINLLSDIRLAPSVIDTVTTQGMIEWLQQFIDQDLAPSYFGTASTNSPLSMLEKYWLDMDPTQTNRLIFFNRNIEPDTYGLWLTLEMATINGLGQTNRLTHLLGDAMVSIWAKDSYSTNPWRPFGQYWISDRSFDSNYWARTRINSYTNISAWFKWTLDINDQRLSTNELINVPAP